MQPTPVAQPPASRAVHALLPGDVQGPAPGLAPWLPPGVVLKRRRLQARECLYRAGQAQPALFLVHAGFFKLSLLSEDGREQVTGFRMRGDVLGLESLDCGTHACDAFALGTSEAWELPRSALAQWPGLQQRITCLLAAELRREREWMLALGTLNAEQRVVAFLLDLAARLGCLGYSSDRLLLRMTRAELGNFLALKLETVSRAFSHLQAEGLLSVDGREIGLEDPAGLRARVQGGRRATPACLARAA